MHPGGTIRWWPAALLLLWAVSAAAVTESIPGDADCDGIRTTADVLHLQAELVDGDGIDVADVDGGGLVSCSGADVNGDGVVTAPDLSALLIFLSGHGTTSLASGPIVTFIGLASADGTLTSAIDGGPAPIFQRAGGLGFRLIVEAAPGPSGGFVGQSVFRSNPADPALRPDLQVIVSNPLGDGDPAVCEEGGGVAAVSPANFGPSQEVADAINDLGCRFSVITNPEVGCTVDAFGAHRFADPRTRVQFCLSVSTLESFIDGDTVVTAQVRDEDDHLGVARQIIVHIGNGPIESPTPTETRPPLPTRTRTPTPVEPPTRTATRTLALSPTATSGPSRTPTRSATVTRTPLVSPTRSPSPTRTRPVATETGTPTGSITATKTRTPTRTTTGVTETATRSTTPTSFATATRTAAPTQSSTRASTGTRTKTSTITPSFTRTRLGEHTATPTATGSPTPSLTRTAIPTRTSSRTPSLPPTRTITGTRPATPTRTPSPPVTATKTRPPTATLTSTASPTGVRTTTRTLVPSITPTPSTTRSATRTLPPSRTATATQTPTVTRTGSRTATATMTGTRTSTGTATRTRTVTPTRTVTMTPTVTRSPTRTATVTATRTVTVTRTPSLTRTQTRTPTNTLVPTVTRTPTITRTRTITRTPTPTPRPGADVTFFGVARPNDEITQPIGTTPEGYPIYERPLAYNFTIVVEGNAPNLRQIGGSAFNYDPVDPNVRPDLQIIVSRPLGDGSTAVCDDMPPVIGGVPASSSFDVTQPISNAINDFACRFIDGSGQPMGRGMSGDACTRFADGDFRFINAASRMQFCASIAPAFGFPLGDTTVMVRLRDSNGVPGPPAGLVIRVSP